MLRSPTARQMSATERSVLRSSAAARSSLRVRRYWCGVSPKARLNSRLKCAGERWAARASAGTSSWIAVAGVDEILGAQEMAGGGQRVHGLDASNVLGASRNLRPWRGRSSSCAASTWALATGSRCPSSATRSQGAGLDDVRTYLQSGNAVVSSAAAADRVRRTVEKLIADGVRARDRGRGANPRPARLGRSAQSSRRCRHGSEALPGELPRQEAQLRRSFGSSRRPPSRARRWSSAAARSSPGTRRASRGRSCGPCSRGRASA